MMQHHILILGGTGEARNLAARLEGQCRLTLSLAGRTINPAGQPVPVRVGGFGGAAGLEAWLRCEGVTVLVDATHPFAARITANAAAAARTAGVPLIALRRPAWQRHEGDRWREVGTVAEAVAALGAAQRRVFVALGRQELTPLLSAPQHFYLVRSVDPVEPPLALPSVAYLLARGPFVKDGEETLFRRYSIDAVLAKNSGGDATYAKLAAARALGIEVVLVRRPSSPEGGIIVASVDEAVRALAHLVPVLSASTPAERGA
ncbi:MAG: cobalt-precorrin-6A reductase [Nitratireductor sp.]